MQDKNIFIFPTGQASVQPELAPPNNLPAKLTPFIGREEEIAAVCTLLRRPEVRLVTLTGTGGVGKTSLALEVASTLLRAFPDGIFFVSLAPISDPRLVISTVAHTLDIWETRDQSLLENLKAYLLKQHPLLLLDNFEQVIEAGPSLVELLQACPDLNILVTSRATLRLYGEYEYVVPALAVPDLTHLPAIEELTNYAAIALFLQQAQALKPDFQLTRENASAIAEICVRLDGLPLAIELAASRVKLLPPKTLLKRLEHRLHVLTGGPRNLPLRQQTLRNTIAWSYDLLSAEEQRLFRRCAAFVGGCTIEAVEAISTALGDETGQVLDRVTSLIDKNLLQQAEQGSEVRMLLLETIREYALEQLVANGEADIIGRAHADYYLALAEEAEPKFRGLEQTAWLERLEREHDNLRAALRWLLEQGDTQDSGFAIEMALRLGGSLREFWHVHDHSREGLGFLERALARSQGVPVAVRAKALSAAAHMSYLQDDSDRAETLAEESLGLYRELGDTEGIALSLHHLERVARMKGNLSLARSRIMESLELWRGLSNKMRIGWSLFRLACQLVVQGEYPEARGLFEENLAIFRELEYKEGITYTLIHLVEMYVLSLDDFELIRTLLKECFTLMREMGDESGEIWCIALAGRLAFLQGDTLLARTLIADALSKARQLGSKSNTAEYLRLLAGVAAAQGNYREAGTRYQDSLELFRELGDKQCIAVCLEGLASVLVEEPVEIRWAPQGQAANRDDGFSRQVYALWAARLCGMAESLREAVGAPLPPVERPTYERAVAVGRTRLGEAVFNRARMQGRSMSLEQVFSSEEPDATLEQVEKVFQSTANRQVLSTYPAGLTEREGEVLRLVAQGMTNPQIAEQLVVSLHTVNSHIRSIFNKLDVNSRNAATRFAIEHKLI